MLLKDCLPFLLHQFPHEHDLVQAIRELSEKFTTNRGHISDYLKDERLASAYTAFYLTTNYPKLAEVMKWMPSAWKEAIKDLPLVDLGAGPGTFSLAWREVVGDAPIFQIETSKVMRAQAQKLWLGLQGTDSMEQLTQVKEIPGSVVVFGHSANEMGAEAALSYISKINPDHILFIEPGTKAFFPEMLNIRRALLAQNYHVLFPCPTANECPLKDRENDWCHQFIEVRHEAEVERLSQLLHLDRKLLPLTVGLFSRTFTASQRERLIRIHAPTKFSFEWDVCHDDKVERYQVLRRGMDKKTQKNIDQLLAGAAIETETEKELQGFNRVKIRRINNISDS